VSTPVAGCDRSLSRVSKGARANNCHGPRLALNRHCLGDSWASCLVRGLQAVRFWWTCPVMRWVTEPSWSRHSNSASTSSRTSVVTASSRSNYLVVSEFLSAQLWLCYILRAIRAGGCRERRYADHIFKNKGTSLLNSAPNSGLGEFCHSVSIVKACYRLSSRKVDAQSVINWAVVFVS